MGQLKGAGARGVVARGLRPCSLIKQNGHSLLYNGAPTPLAGTMRPYKIGVLYNPATQPLVQFPTRRIPRVRKGSLTVAPKMPHSPSSGFIGSAGHLWGLVFPRVGKGGGNPLTVARGNPTPSRGLCLGLVRFSRSCLCPTLPQVIRPKATRGKAGAVAPFPRVFWGALCQPAPSADGATLI